MNTRLFETNLERLISAISNDGEPLDVGIPEEAVLEVYQSTKNAFSGKNIVAVKFWSWWDVYLEGEQVGGNAIPGYSVLKADQIIQSNHWNASIRTGNWVRTSALKAFHVENAVFETASSCYILVGSGSRKKIASREAMSFF